MKKTLEIVQEVVGYNIHIDIDTDLLQEGVLDSLGIVRLVGKIEDEFKIRIDVDDLIPENFVNVQAIDKLVGCGLRGNQ